jgi:hypothetical protein
MLQRKAVEERRQAQAARSRKLGLLSSPSGMHLKEVVRIAGELREYFIHGARNPGLMRPDVGAPRPVWEVEEAEWLCLLARVAGFVLRAKGCLVQWVSGWPFKEKVHDYTS